MTMAFIQLSGLDGKTWVAVHQIKLIAPAIYKPFVDRGAKAIICFSSSRDDDLVPVTETPNEVISEVAKALNPSSTDAALMRRMFEGSTKP